MKQVLSLGAGVQSSTVLLMSIVGELESLDGAVFSDTGWEPQAVYDHLQTLSDFVEREVGWSIILTKTAAARSAR